MPLSEDEQRILAEIEDNLTASDPALAELSETTVYRHAARRIYWGVTAFVVGLVLLVVTFTKALVLGVVGFLVMLGAALIVSQGAQKMGKAGWNTLTTRWRSRLHRS